MNRGVRVHSAGDVRRWWWRRRAVFWFGLACRADRLLAYAVDRLDRLNGGPWA